MKAKHTRRQTLKKGKKKKKNNEEVTEKLRQ
jgi:hypothetical protein